MCIACIGMSVLGGLTDESLLAKVLNNKYALSIKKIIADSAIGNWVKHSPEINLLNRKYSVIKQTVANSSIGVWYKKVSEIKVPEHRSAWWVSKITTSSLMILTIVALKTLFNFSICQGGGLNLKTFILLSTVSIPLGRIYSIGVNYLLGRFIYKPICPVSGNSPCCCANSSKLAEI
jgi:hypothetical protein